MKILIVDDEPLVRSILRQIVESHGHEVIEAGDGQEGLEKASEHKPDAIISDAMMPKMDGYQFLRAVRQDETLSRIPFVVYTAIYTGEKEHELALALGADALIVKPKKPGEFWKEFIIALDAHAGKNKEAIQERLTETEEDYIRDYCRVVAAKLEEKVGELEETIKLHRRTENELRIMEKTLQSASAEWRKTFDAMGNAIVLLDLNGRILRCNRAMAELAGMDYSEIVGRQCWEIVHATSGPVDYCPSEIMKKTGKRETIVTQRGNRWFEVTADPYSDNEGNLLGAVLIMVDITERKMNEEALRSSEEMYRLIFQRSPVGIFYYNNNLKITDCNNRLIEILETKREKLISLDLGTLTDQSGVPALEAAIAGKEGQYEGFYKSTTGSAEIWAFMRTAPLFSQGGAVKGGIGILEDITERKLAEQVLKEREEQLAQITREWEETFNSITDMVTVHDKDFNIVRANKASDKILGLPFFKVGKVKCFEYYHGTGRPPDGCPSCETLVTGKPSITELFDPHLNMQIEIRAIPRLDSNNQVIGLIHVVRDISERKKSEEALERYSKELTSLSMASDTLLLITNLKDVYQEICNIIYSVFDLKMVWLAIVEEGTFEVTPVAFAGFEDGYLSTIRVTWDDSPTGLGPVGIAIKTRKPFKTDTNEPVFARWKAEAQKRGYIELVSMPLVYESDKCLGTLNFYSDNTEYFTPDRIKLFQIFANQVAAAIGKVRLIESLEGKVNERTKDLEDANCVLQLVNKELILRREEADAASRSKTGFLANMSHELRTPLNAIIGFTDIMQAGMAGPVTEKQKEFLTDISSSGEHLLSLITDILDLSKIEAGKMELELGPVSMKEIIESSLIMFKEKAQRHKIKLTSEIEDTITSTTADQRKLKQVIVNLLSNAFKFTPDGGSVGVAARTTASPITSDDLIEISVTDTGIGISDEDQQRLFNPFQQIETSLTRKYAGTGLGLSLCRCFIELHGGRIWVESEPGKGSRFAFIIPMKQ